MNWAERFFHDQTILALLVPPNLFGSAETLQRGGGAPKLPGIYAWYFDEIPRGVDDRDCHRLGKWTLLYCGISPQRPPANGRAASRSHVRRRLQTHYTGNAYGSTLRLTLGCLLEIEIGTVLRRVGATGRFTFTNPGEQLLDTWMQDHARVAWAEDFRPWEAERRILSSGLPLPLNIEGNPCQQARNSLSAVRSAARRRAETMPLIPDSGGPRRPKIDVLPIGTSGFAKE